MTSTAITERARGQWAPGQVELIKNTVAQNATDAELGMFLELAARYQLDPFANEIWFAKGKSRDGSPGRLLLMVGRDGLLKVARSRPDYRGIDHDVVRENDEFRVERKSDGTREISHAYSGTDVQRGAVMGAWALVHLEGKPSVYYYAPISEYKPTGDGALRYSPWGSQESVMILKCAQAYALRIACGITGVYGEGEADKALAEAGTPTAIEATAATELPPEQKARLDAAVAEAEALRPGVVTPAAIQMSVAGQPPEAVDEFIHRVEVANAQARVEQAEPEPPEAEVVPDAEIEPGSGSRTSGSGA